MKPGIASEEDARVADSYNDCLKWVDPQSRAVKTWVRGFHEPGGVCFGMSHAYVADTNAHRIAAMHMETGNVVDLRIE